MKNFKLMATMILFSMIIVSQIVAQPASERIETHSLEITFHKTTSIIFPAAIESVDRGSRDVLAQKAKGVENILQLKAAKTDFTETNLTVIASNGKLYHFIVNYVDSPLDLIIDLNKRPKTQETRGKEYSPVIFKSPVSKLEMATYANAITSSKRKVWLANNSHNKVTLSLHGIYIQENAIFYHLKLKNHSNIDYDIDFLRFYIRDKKQVKRTASQEVEVKPIFVNGDANKSIEGKSEIDLVYALEKFTIPDAKHLVIELFEEHGGRHLDLRIGNRMIVNARPVPDRIGKGDHI